MYQPRRLNNTAIWRRPPPPRAGTPPVVGREMGGRLALALELLDTALRADWERHTLPLGQAPLPLQKMQNFLKKLKKLKHLFQQNHN